MSHEHWSAFWAQAGYLMIFILHGAWQGVTEMNYTAAFFFNHWCSTRFCLLEESITRFVR